ncbi:MAG: site-specific integrase [Candidatus Saccharibacteria bacterium]|nr:site-specific integrase [Candidatus Saccharibacteria bacterium]
MILSLPQTLIIQLERLTGRSLYRLVKSLLKELNIDKDIHSFRHFFVTQLIDNGFEIMQTMKLSRHKSLPMMQVYYDESQSLEFTDEMLNSFGV